MIPQHIIDQILDRVDIVEVISSYLQLKRAGHNFKAQCPFHDEKTPSFIVAPDKQIYHCFGCGAGGNVISFIMKYENMTFPEAIKLMAEKARVELPSLTKEDKVASSMATSISKINDLATSFYMKTLKTKKGDKALEYLKARGIKGSTIETFKIGYAPDGWEEFQKLCLLKNIPVSLARKAGLLIKSEKGQNDYDRFRNRIMYPICNDRGNVVAFGARVMDNSLPKYINSPDTPVYNKSSILYGLNHSKRSIVENDFVLIVEGYMDVILPFQHNITNLVATSGTALTQQQAMLIKKYTNNAVMIFDADTAGEAASLRGLDILVENGINVRIVRLPVGDDPDSFVRKYGKEKFDSMIKEAKDLFDYKFDLLLTKYPGNEVINKTAVINEMLPTISRLDNAVSVAAYLRKLSEKLGVDELAVREELKKVKGPYSYGVRKIEEKNKKGQKNNSLEMYTLGLSIAGKPLFSLLMEEVGLEGFKDERIKDILSLMLGIYEKEESINTGKLLSRFENNEEMKSIILQAMTETDFTEEKEKALKDCINKMKREKRDARLKSLSDSLKKAQSSKNDNEINEILFKINKLYKEKV